jgi:hypothetical protein
MRTSARTTAAMHGRHTSPKSFRAHCDLSQW